MRLKFKRTVSVLLAGVIGATYSLTGLCIESSELFTYTEYGEDYKVSALVDNYQSLLDGKTEITLPVSYNGKVCSAVNASIFNGNTYFTKVTLPNTYSATNTALFKNCTSLKEAVFECTGTFRISITTFSGCTSLEKLYIYADSLYDATNKTVFTNVPSTAIAYVKNETVKEQLANWPGKIEVNPKLGEQISSVDKVVLTNKINEIEKFLSEIDESKYNNIEELKEALVSAKTVNENASATQEEVNSEYLKLSTALSNATKKTDKTELSNKITEVETFLSGIDKSKYNNIAALEAALAHAKTVNENALATQTEVNNEVIALTTALNNVYPVADKTALSSKITEAETFLSGIDKSKYNNVAALETAIAHAKTVNENALATQTEVDNEVTALTSALGNVKLTDKTKLGNMIGVYEKFIGEIDKTTYTNVEAFETALAHAKTVYNSDTATQEEVDKELEDLMTARGNMKPIVDKTALKETIDKAEAFKEDKLESDYDNYKNFTDVIVTAKMYYESDSYTQEQLNGVKDRLIAAQEKVTKADASEEKAQLDKLIEQAEALESDIFTEESWLPVETALTEAKAIDDGLKSEYNAAIEKLNTALKGLVGIELPTVPAGKPFAKVYKKGRTATVINTTADKDMAKATKIRVTFDCAEDVSYNPNASIEIKAMVGGIESYKKFIGKDSSYKNGETWTEELTLTEAINEGDSVELSAFTYSWDNAADYVYGITKVEFLNIGGSVVKSYNDQIVAVAELKTAIEKAEAIDTTPYTAESVAELTKAIEDAKALTDESTADELNSAINAINTAIKNLKEPDPTKPDPTKPNPTKQEPSKPTQKPTAKPTTASTKSTRSSEAVAKDKKAATKVMKQAKIKKLTTKSKSKKKITVSWKKVKKAKGYQVEVSAKKNFKKPIFKKFTAKTKLNIKNKKIKSGKKYYVRVRAYATYKDKNNVTQKVYSRWNKKIRKVTVK